MIYDRQRDIERTEWALDTLGIDVDHTSGAIRCRYRVLGGHVHCRIFGPYTGKAGDLVFRVEEWDHVRRINPGWQFTEEPA